MLKGITLYYKVLLQYYFVLQSTTLYHKIRCWIILYILEKKNGHSIPDLVPDQIHGIQGQWPFTAMLPRRQNKSVCPVQNHLIQFKSYIKWLLWFQALRSKRTGKKKKFTKVVVPDNRIIAERSRPVYRPIAIYFHFIGWIILLTIFLEMLQIT